MTAARAREPEDWTEEEALVALRAGDITGLAMLVHLHQTQLLRASYALCRDRQMAEDAVADSFLTLWERCDRLDPSRPFLPYFYRIVVNQTLKALRARSKTRPSGSAFDVLGNAVDPQREPDAGTVAEESRCELLAAIGRLPGKQREVVVLRHYLEMDERAIASTLAIPVGTVKWRLYTARRRLRILLNPPGGVT